MNNSAANSRNERDAAQPPSTVPDRRRSLRWSVYLLLIFVSLGAMLGRILAVDSVDKPARARRPFLSANDRSRWCTVRALVENDMRVEGAPYAIDQVIQQPNWDTIDMVKHDGHLYSSKPPLLPTLMAAVYWPIYRFGGVSLGTHPYEIGRFMLVLFNLIPLAIYFLLLGRAGRAFWDDRLGADFCDGRGLLRHVLDHLRRRDQQPSAGGRLRGGGRLRRRAHLVRRRATAALFHRGRAVRRAGRGQRVAGLVAFGGDWRCAVVESAEADAAGLHAGGARGGGRFLRHQLDRPSQPRAGLHAP